MTDRTSHSYRGDTPGSNPDMYSQGGKAREAFREARMSPYIRQETQKQAASKDAFLKQRKSLQPKPKRPRSR
jgi:hypothetical protein